jgi:hypothetical protein
MSCELFERWLDDQWERRRRPAMAADDALSSHIDDCDACRDRLLAHQQLFDGLAAWERPTLESGFARSVVARWAQEKDLIDSPDSEPTVVRARDFAHKPRWSARQTAIWLQVAAALLLAAFTLLWRGGDVKPTGGATGQDPVAAGSVSDESTSGIASTDSNAARRPRAVREWNPANEFQSVAMFFLSPPDLKTVVVIVNRRVLELLGDPAGRVERLPGSLRQVARSVNVTIDILRQAIPGATLPADALPDQEEERRDAPPSSDEQPRRNLGVRDSIRPSKAV